MPIELTSPVFRDGEPIPSRYTCDGDDVSPPLQWRGVPEAAKSLAIICEDSEAPSGTFTHWLVYGLSPATSELPQGIHHLDVIPNGARQGINDSRRVGYGGPCPPKGSVHRYVFRIFALDRELPLKPAATRADLLEAMKGHVLDEGRLTGTFRR